MESFSFTNWINNMRSSSRGTRRSKRRPDGRTSRSFRPLMESLEDRVVLDASPLGTAALLEAPTAGIAADAVTTSGAWTAVANDSWLHVQAGNDSGTGDGTAIFTLDANTGPTRVGTLTIAGETLTVTQAGSTYEAANGMPQLVPGGLGIAWADVAVDSAGNVYFTTASNNLEEWNASTQTVSILVTGLDRPGAVAVDGAGNVFFADDNTSYGDTKVKEWNASTQAVSTLTIPALTRWVSGLAVDGDGNLYIDDQDYYIGPPEILKYDTTNDTSGVLFYAPTRNPNGGSAWAGGIAVDAAGNVYLAGFDTIYEWNAATNSVSSPITGLDNCYGVAVDGSGDIYFDDFAGDNNGEVQEWQAATQTVATLLSVNESQSSQPSGVAVDPAGNLYISASNSGNIRELPHAFVPTTPFNEFAAAGVDSLGLPVLTTTQSLTGVFAPTSNESWLTITGVAGNVVNFSFTQNATGRARTANIDVLGQEIAVTQSGDVAPAVTTQPTNQAVNALSTVSFTAAASGAPTPNVQWSVSTDNGAEFTPIAGATSGTLSFTATGDLSGNEYEAVFTNSLGDVTTNPVTLTVNQLNATVTLGSLNQVYDGLPEAATATTSATGASSFTITYDGSTTPPTAAGSYTVVATLVNTNYQGSDTETMVIAQASSSTTATDAGGPYTGSAYAATAEATGAGGLDDTTTADFTISYYAGSYATVADLNAASPTALVGGAPSAAGSYTALAVWTPDANHTGSSGVADFTITQADANPSVAAIAGLVYNGSPQTTAGGSATDVFGHALPASDFNLAATLHTDAGNYSDDAWTFHDPSGNYQDANGTVDDSIAQAAATVLVSGYTGGVYDGNAHSRTVTVTGVGNDGTLFTTTLNGTNAGVHIQPWSFTNRNYLAADENGVLVFPIIRANARPSVTAIAGLVYNGSPQTTASGSATDVFGHALPASDFNLAATVHTDAGNYSDDAWTFHDPSGNYQDANGTVDDSIAQAPLTVVASNASGVEGQPARPSAARSPASRTAIRSRRPTAPPRAPPTRREPTRSRRPYPTAAPARWPTTASPPRTAPSRSPTRL